jgi:hypothetical protein
MLFNTPDRYGEGQRLEGFSVIVYKFGKSIGDYYGNSEMLVAIWCRLNDPDLGQANLVGRQLSEIRARFGEPFKIIRDVWIYEQHARVVSLHVSGDAVDWFKYARLSRNFNAASVEPGLLNPGPRW